MGGLSPTWRHCELRQQQEEVLSLDRDGEHSTDSRAVFFDLGGTLCSYDTAIRAQELAFLDVLGMLSLPDSARTFTQAYHAHLRRAYARRLTVPFYLHSEVFCEAFVATVRAAGMPELEPYFEAFRTRLQRHQLAHATLRAYALETLACLRDRGLCVAIVSNSDDDYLASMIESLGLQPAVDFHLSSQRAGSCKPDDKIFRYALELAGCAPGSALYVGDTISKDVVGANRVGMSSALLRREGYEAEEVGERRPNYLLADLRAVIAVVEETSDGGVRR